MADSFKQKFSGSTFSEFIKRIRDKLGKATSRTLHASNAYESPPGLPKGHYRELVFNTKFANDPRMIFEIVALVGEKGAWRVTSFHFAVRNDRGQIAPRDLCAETDNAPRGNRPFSPPESTAGGGPSRAAGYCGWVRALRRLSRPFVARSEAAMRP